MMLGEFQPMQMQTEEQQHLLHFGTEIAAVKFLLIYTSLTETSPQRENVTLCLSVTTVRMC